MNGTFYKKILLCFEFATILGFGSELRSEAVLSVKSVRPESKNEVFSRVCVFFLILTSFVSRSLPIYLHCHSL